MESFHFARRGTVVYQEALPFAGCDFLIHAFSTRLGGVSETGFASLNFSLREGDAREKVSQNWDLLAGAFGLSLQQFLVMNQQHGDRIIVLRGAGPEDRSGQPFPEEMAWQADALITDQPGTALVVKTADCVPLLFLDEAKRAIGVVHAGWRGTALQIAGRAVEAFVDTFASRPEDIRVAIGPAIGPCCYQVDAPVYGALAGQAENPSFLHPCGEEGRWMLDLVLANRRHLEDRGVPRANVCASPCCTSCREDAFFSHRRDGVRTGRHVNFIMLKEPEERRKSY